ncbi:hypothetical protein [Streptomyces sp. NPDC093591]|uniref:hypothetical protein n=1 Tax=Streptomyces sp. NPDC093591 TaxID=3366044 RepID=UPI0038073D49
MTGPACGNNPNYRMSEGDRRAVEDFKAYLADRAALRDRIAEALYAHDHPGHVVPLDGTGMEPAYWQSAGAVLAVLPASVDRAAEEHRLALSEALGLGTGAPWDAIHDRVTELGLPPLGQDPVARRLGLLAEYRAAILTEAADAVFALDYDVMVGEEGDENLGSMREAWDLGTIHAMKLLRRMAAAPAAVSAVPGQADGTQPNVTVDRAMLTAVLREVLSGFRAVDNAGLTDAGEVLGFVGPTVAPQDYQRWCDIATAEQPAAAQQPKEARP